MKKTFKFFAAALAIVAAASCAKEISNDDIQAPEQELVHKVFTASFDTDTKTTLADDGLSVHWTEGDAIKLYPQGGSPSDFMISSFDKDFASFEGNTSSADSYGAIYPSSAYLAQLNSFYYSHYGYYVLASNESKSALASQFAVENNFSIVEDFNSSSNFAISHGTQDDHLYFSNINAHLKIRLAMDNAASIEVSADKVMCAPDESGSGQSRVSDAKLGGPIVYYCKGKVKIGVYPGMGDDITFKKQDGTNLLPNVDYYIAIPAVKMDGLKLVVKDANGKVLQSLTKSTFTPSSNTIYNLGTIEPAPVVAAEVGDYFYSDGTYSTGLDENKTVVGVVFYIGDPTSDDITLREKYPNCVNGLVVGLTQANAQVGTLKITWDSDGYMTTTGAKYQFVMGQGGSVQRLEPGYLMTGYNNTEAIRAVDAASSLITICDGMPSVNSVSTWFIPTIAEFDAINASRGVVNASISAVGGSVLSGAYVTSTQEDATYIATYNVDNKELKDITKHNSGEIRPIFAF